MPFSAFTAVSNGSTGLVLKLLYWKYRPNSASVGALTVSTTAPEMEMLLVVTLKVLFVVWLII